MPQSTGTGISLDILDAQGRIQTVNIRGQRVQVTRPNGTSTVYRGTGGPLPVPASARPELEAKHAVPVLKTRGRG